MGFEKTKLISIHRTTDNGKLRNQLYVNAKKKCIKMKSKHEVIIKQNEHKANPPLFLTYHFKFIRI